MSREVRRVPMDWQHPMEWAERWDRERGRVAMQLIPRPLFDDYPGALAAWERESAELAAREGWDWGWYLSYCLTGYQGRDDDAEAIHPFVTGAGDACVEVTVRDEDHLHQLLTAEQAAKRPAPAYYMPDFSDRNADALGWCMYETTSEGTPISPVMESPESLAHWLADTGASAFGGMTATYEQWMATIRSGWAPSMFASPTTGVTSGVAWSGEAS